MGFEQQPLTLRQGWVVDAVGDGVVDVELPDGTVVDDVTVIGGEPAVGDPVVMLSTFDEMCVLGVGGSAGGGLTLAEVQQLIDDAVAAASGGGNLYDGYAKVSATAPDPYDPRWEPSGGSPVGMLWIDEDATPTVVTGPAGPAGLSAFQIAVQHGFVGTVDEWLAGLKGADGKSVNVYVRPDRPVPERPGDLWIEKAG